MKKVLAIIFSVVFVLSFATVAFAADTTPTQHTYKAFQIFAGTLSTSDGTTELKNVTWGSGIDDAKFLAALKADATFGDTFDGCTTAAEVAAIIGGANGTTPWADNSDNAKHFARLAYKYKDGSGVTATNGMTTLEAGYYLVVDTTEFPGTETGTYRNLALLQMTGKGTFDIAMKSSVPTLQKKVKDINDSNDEGLSEWQDSADYDIGDTIPFQLKATIGTDISMFETYELIFHDTGCDGLAVDDESFVVTVAGGDALTADEDYKVELNGNDFTVTIYDVKAEGATTGSVITVEYNAVLDTDATIGAAGNPNEVYLEYSSNPNYISQTATPDEVNEFGKTPVDKVIVFTYQLNVNKIEMVDESKQALNGAGFTLFKKDSEDNWVPVGEEVVNEEGNTFSWVGIDDGDYKLEETTVPKGYAKMKDLEFTVDAEHDVLSDNPALISLTGGDMFTGTVDDIGILEGDIENSRKGAILPETGGMGTKIFYGAGSVLVVGAAILLITKKRMKSEVAE